MNYFDFSQNPYPTELILKIFGYFDHKQILIARKINKNFSNIALNIMFDRYYFNINNIHQLDYIYQNVQKLVINDLRKNILELNKFTSIRELVCLNDINFCYQSSDELDEDEYKVIKLDIKENKMFEIKKDYLPPSIEKLILEIDLNITMDSNLLSGLSNLSHLEIQSDLFEKINTSLPIIHLKIYIKYFTKKFAANLNLITPDLKELWIEDITGDIVYDISLDKLDIIHLTLTTVGNVRDDFGIERMLIIPKSVTHLTIYGDFGINRKELETLPNGLLNLIMDWYIPKYGEYINKYMRSFIGPIKQNWLPSTLEVLVLGDFKLQICPYVLPDSLKELKLPAFDNSIEHCVFPKYLEKLDLRSLFYNSINNGILPVSLKSLRIDSIKTNHSRSRLPELKHLTNLTKLTIGSNILNEKDYQNLLPLSLNILKLRSQSYNPTYTIYQYPALKVINSRY